MHERAHEPVRVRRRSTLRADLYEAARKWDRLEYDLKFWSVVGVLLVLMLLCP